MHRSFIHKELSRMPFQPCYFWVFYLPYVLAMADLPMAHGATITVNNTNGTDVEFNDPILRTPIGGNKVTTFGKQRLNVFNFAASLWGKLLQSDVNIVVEASFDNFACDANSAVLGGVGTRQIFADF
jgi:hypothetical protein